MASESDAAFYPFTNVRMNITTHEPSISTCLIIKNEERMLADCLESVRALGGEIVVVDTGSDDASVSIAERYGAKVLQHRWNDDFADARNVAIQAATGRWILAIDADERLLNPDLVKAVVAAATTESGGFLLKIHNSALRPDGTKDRFQTQVLRLFRNQRDIRFEGIIHEQVLDSILAAGLKVMYSPIELLHLGYEGSEHWLRSKQERNLVLLERQCAVSPQNVYALLNLGKTLLALGEQERGRATLLNALQLSQPGSVHRLQALNYLAALSLNAGHLADAQRYCTESLAAVSSQSFVHYVLAEVFWEQKLFDKSFESYRMALNFQVNPEIHASIIGQQLTPESILLFKIGRSLVAMGHAEQALGVFESALALDPSELANLVGLANCQAILGDRTSALRTISTALERSPENPQALGLLAELQRRHETMIPKGHAAVRDPEKRETPRKRPLISLSMIVRNEESMLGACLDSVRGIVDEIVVVDTGSHDGTVELARAYGAKVFHFPWIDDFAAARNEALSHCTGEWILYLDADERIHSQAREHLRPMLEKMPESVGALICTLESPTRHRGNDTELHRGSYPRIFRNYGYPTIHFIGRVHEQITPSILALSKEVLFSEVVINHVGYDIERAAMEAKVQRNYRLLLRHVKEEPDNGYAWFQLGQTLGRMDLIDQAIDALKLAIDLGVKPVIEASAAATLSQFYGNRREFEKALDYAEHALKQSPEQVYARHLRAYSLLHLGRFQLAEQGFLDVLDRLSAPSSTFTTGFDIAIPREAAFEGLRRAQSELTRSTGLVPPAHRKQ